MDYFHIALPADQLRTVSSIGLAHVGDGVYELLVRTWLCAHGKATGKDLHRAAIALVCAPEQARRAQRILPLLTPEEDAVFKRGRNAAVHGIPKNATTAQYQQDHLIPGGLLDLLDAAAGDLGRQLLHYALQADGV